jgi:hypothetical protein
MEEQAPNRAAVGAVPSKQEQAILLLLTHPLYERLLKPLCRPRNGNFANGITDIFFSQLDYGVLSGGEQGAISWAFAIWRDEVNPEMRDPFERFGAMHPKLQQLVLEAMSIRHDVAGGLEQAKRFEVFEDGN